jgi:hypothetical protein
LPELKLLSLLPPIKELFSFQSLSYSESSGEERAYFFKFLEFFLRLLSSSPPYISSSESASWPGYLY